MLLCGHWQIFTWFWGLLVSSSSLCVKGRSDSPLTDRYQGSLPQPTETTEISSHFTKKWKWVYFFLLSTNEDILKNVGKQTVAGSHWLPLYGKKILWKSMGCCQLSGYQHSSKYLHLCSTEERNSDRFGTAWEWVDDDKIFIFGELSLQTAWF